MNKYRRLSGVDSVFVYMESAITHHHTLKISIIDPSTDPDGWNFETYLQHARDTFPLVSLWRERCLKTPFGLHYPIWVDDPNFDIEYHIRHIACPAPGDNKAFCKLVSELYSRGLDIRRPLWQMWVIEGLEGGRVAMVLMLHHAYSDGVGILRLLDIMLPPEPGVLEPGAKVPPPASRLPNRLTRLWWGVKDLPPLFIKNFWPLLRGISGARRVKAEALRSGESQPPSPANRNIPLPFSYALDSANRTFSCRSMQLAEFRRVSKALGYTINDVFIACAAGAVRRYLEQEGRPFDQATIATMPMNLLPAEQRTVLGNFATVEHVLLHVEIADPLQRLQASSETCIVAKQHFQKNKDVSISALMNMLHPYVIVFLNWLNKVRGGRIFPLSNIALSNVPGPREKRYLRRWLVDEWYSTGQISHGVALNITVWSYADQYNICVLTDKTRLGNSAVIIDHFEAALREYLALADAAPVSA